jgi:methyl-accepting chemotaxis protein
MRHIFPQRTAPNLDAGPKEVIVYANHISAKLLLASLVLGVTVLFVALAGAQALHSLMAGTRAMENSTHRALLAKRVDALVLAVVMDTRGVYMSASPADAEKFIVPMLANLSSLEDKVAAWKVLVPASGSAVFANIQDQVDQFVTSRRELVRLAREVGIAPARAFGDNPQSRSVRQRLNTVLEDSSIVNDAKVVEITRELEAAYVSDLWMLGLAAVVGLVIGMAASIRISSRAVSTPIIGMTAIMERLAAGDHTITIPWNDRTDEIGHMATALAVFRENAVAKARLEHQQAEDHRRAEAVQRQTLSDLASELEQRVTAVLGRVSTASTELESTSRSMAEVAEQTNLQATAAASASEQASANAQTVAEAAGNLSIAITEISRQVGYAGRTSRVAVDKATHTGEIVSSLSDAAGEIGKVVGLITRIAAQTNLLALNASIEASRAGLAGHGFAVVAAEVKSLAHQTAAATDEVARHIQSVQAATHEAVQAIEDILSIITVIDDASTTIAAAVEEQQAATREIARNVDESAGATGEIAHNMTGMLDAAGKTGQAAGQVLDEAHHLSEYSVALGLEIHAFVDRLRGG